MVDKQYTSHVAYMSLRSTRQFLIKAKINEHAKQRKQFSTHVRLQPHTQYGYFWDVVKKIQSWEN